MRTMGVARRACCAALLVIASLFALSGVVHAKAGEPTSGVVYAGVTHVEGDDLYVAGDFNDDLLGRGAIVYVTRVSTDHAGAILVEARKINIYTPKGSLTGKGSAVRESSQGSRGRLRQTAGGRPHQRRRLRSGARPEVPLRGFEPRFPP